jgi:hypothetical protein
MCTTARNENDLDGEKHSRFLDTISATVTPQVIYTLNRQGACRKNNVGSHTVNWRDGRSGRMTKYLKINSSNEAIWMAIA